MRRIKVLAELEIDIWDWAFTIEGVQGFAEKALAELTYMNSEGYGEYTSSNTPDDMGYMELVSKKVLEAEVIL